MKSFVSFLTIIIFHKDTVGEKSTTSLLQKEKSGSAKSAVSKVLFPDTGKITNLNSPIFRSISQLCKISWLIFSYSERFTDEFIL